jgi:hypothetical protein
MFLTMTILKIFSLPKSSASGYDSLLIAGCNRFWHWAVDGAEFFGFFFFYSANPICRFARRDFVSWST